MDDKKQKTNKVEQEEIKEQREEERVENSKQENVDEVQKELEQLRTLTAKLEDNYKRALADYQNLQRRTVDEKREWAKLSNKDLVLKFLPILDTLMLAEKHTQDKNFVLTVQQFLSALEQEGVKRIDTVGKEFDPNLMECVTTQEGEKNKVLEELRAGYTMFDNVLRSAQVIVGQG